MIGTHDAILDVVVGMFSKRLFHCEPGALAILFMKQSAQLRPRHTGIGWNVEDSRRCFRHSYDVRFCIPLPIAKPRSCESEFQTFGSFVECATCLSLVRNVACNFGSPNNLAVRASNRGHCQKNIPQHSLFSPTHNFIILNALALPQFLKNLL